MVQALSPDRADQAFGVRILPRTLRCRQYFLDLQGRDPQTNVVAVDAIPIADEKPRCLPFGEGLDDLLGGPGRRGMLGYIEVQHLATTVFQHEEHEQNLHRDRGYGEEVNGNHLADMIV